MYNVDVAYKTAGLLRTAENISSILIRYFLAKKYWQYQYRYFSTPFTCLILLPVASLWTLYLQTLWSYTTKPIFCNCLLDHYILHCEAISKIHKQFCCSVCYKIFLPSSILHDVSNYKNFKPKSNCNRGTLSILLLKVSATLIFNKVSYRKQIACQHS